MAKDKLKADDVILGEEFKDIITGFEGIATSKHTYINGCNQIGLSRQRGDEPKVLSFDVERLERIGDGVAADFRPEDLSSPGGPGDDLAAAGPPTSLVLMAPPPPLEEVLDPEIEMPFHGGPADGHEVWVQLDPGAVFPDGVVLAHIQEHQVGPFILAEESHFAYRLTEEGYTFVGAVG